MRTEVFISGKNWKLSLAELAFFLENSKATFQVSFFSKDFFVVKEEQDFGAKAVPNLGGTIKCGTVLASFPTEIVKEAFLDRSKEAQEKINDYVRTSGICEDMSKLSLGKVFFGVSVYCPEKQLRPYSGHIQRFIGSAIKTELASIERNSKFMGFAKDRKNAQLSHIEVLKKNLVEKKAEILFCIGKQETLITTTTAVHNPFEFQKRDIYKPRQRKIFGMPPRMARIMVNLSLCMPGKVLLDPFCGVGTVLQEALLSKAKVLGTDINPWCVKATIDNLLWLEKEYNLENAEFRIIQSDVGKLASKIGLETVDCIVSEPDLGPALRQVPTRPYAQKIIEKLEPLFYSFIEEAHKVLKPDGRLVLVTPYIMTRSGHPITMPIDEKAESVGFQKVSPFKKEIFSEGTGDQESLLKLGSLIEVDERHKIGREIHIFKK